MGRQRRRTGQRGDIGGDGESFRQRDARVVAMDEECVVAGLRILRRLMASLPKRRDAARVRTDRLIDDVFRGHGWPLDKDVQMSAGRGETQRCRRRLRRRPAERGRDLRRQQFERAQDEGVRRIDGMDLEDDLLRPRQRGVAQQALDHLLDCACVPEGLALFKTLCRHYWHINTQATADYVSAYREMWDNDSDPEQEAVS